MPSHPAAVRRLMLVAAAAMLVAAALCAAPALAYDETSGTPPGTPDDTSMTLGEHPACDRCHGGYIEAGGACGACHYSFPGPGLGAGPHGYYITTTSRCSICHTVHNAPAGGIMLLPGATIKATCLTCHDGTAGYGVYGAILEATGLDPGASHSIDTTDVVPGGDPNTGGPATMSFSGEGGALSCNDCHSPHAASTVATFAGDRQRTTLTWQKSSTRHHVTYSTKLLKALPTGATTAVAEYGSDWCLACHKGRDSGGAVHNHPVDSAAETPTPFTYSNVAVLVSDSPTGETTLTGLGGWNRTGAWSDPIVFAENRGFLMPVPRTSDQEGHNPICMQCHEDARDVGDLVGSGTQGDAEPFDITHEDGTVAGDNPRFQNFPHEAVNADFLIEEDDDLCSNCHPLGGLP
jgi:predicted CXXCH cytochrome family protein